MCDVDLLPTMYDEATPVARKQHRCDACLETIQPRQRYVRIFGVWDGEAETIKQCLRCQAIGRALLGAGADTYDLKLDCGETWDDVFGPPPDDVAALAFAIPSDFNHQPRRPS